MRVRRPVVFAQTRMLSVPHRGYVGASWGVASGLVIDFDEALSALNRIALGHVDSTDGAGLRRGNFRFHLHGFQHEQDLT